MLSIGDIEVTSSPDIVLLDRLNVKKDTPGAYRTDILSVIKVILLFWRVGLGGQVV